MQKVKKLSAIMICLLMICSLSLVVSAAKGKVQPIQIYVNDELIPSDVEPTIMNDRTMVPIRVISENLGAEVVWNKNTRTVTVIYGSMHLALPIDSDHAVMNEMKIPIDSPAVILNERTMVPLRFIGEAMGVDVEWINETRSVIVTGGKPLNFLAVTYEQKEGVDTVTLHMDRMGEYEVLTLDNPFRIVLDVENATPGTITESKKIENSSLTNIRAGQFSTDPLVARLVLDFNAKIDYEVKADKTSKTISISFKNDFSNFTYKESNYVTEVILSKVTSDIQPSLSYDSSQSKLRLTLPGFTPAVYRTEVVPGVSAISKTVISQSGGNTYVDFFLTAQGSYRMEQKSDGLHLYLGQAVKSASVEDTKDYTEINLTTQNYLPYKVVEKTETKVVLEFTDTAYYGGNLTVNSVAVNDVQFENRNGNLYVTVNVPFLYKVEVNEVKTKTSITFYKTDYMGRVIVIDPGHGGYQPGTVVNGVQEKDITLAVALKLRDELRASGATVYMIREDDSYMKAEERPGVAATYDPDIFVSIHINSWTTDKPKGTEVHYIEKDNGISKSLAECIQNAIIEDFNTVDRGLVSDSNLVINRLSTMPSCLVEMAFLSNPSDFELLTSADFPDRMAKSIAKGILEFFKRREI